MKVSIVTAVYNGEKFIADCMKSVAKQTHADIEHIVVDGLSKDRTLEVVKAHSTPKTRWISEKDKNLYDAMNKGLRAATGEIIGILNADDFYVSAEVIASVVAAFQNSETKIVIGDLEFVDPIQTDKVTRHVSPKNFQLPDFLKGEQPPHPTVFVRREIYEKFGLFDIQYPVVADYDLLLRFLYVHRVPWAHLPHTLIRMRTGGLSNRSWVEKLKFNAQKVAICRSHGLKTGLFHMLSRYPRKALSLLRR